MVSPTVESMAASSAGSSADKNDENRRDAGTGPSLASSMDGSAIDTASLTMGSKNFCSRPTNSSLSEAGGINVRTESWACDLWSSTGCLLVDGIPLVEDVPANEDADEFCSAFRHRRPTSPNQWMEPVGDFTVTAGTSGSTSVSACSTTSSSAVSDVAGMGDAVSREGSPPLPSSSSSGSVRDLTASVELARGTASPTLGSSGFTSTSGFSDTSSSAVNTSDAVSHKGSPKSPHPPSSSSSWGSTFSAATRSVGAASIGGDAEGGMRYAASLERAPPLSPPSPSSSLGTGRPVMAASSTGDAEGGKRYAASLERAPPSSPPSPSSSLGADRSIGAASVTGVGGCGAEGMSASVALSAEGTSSTSASIGLNNTLLELGYKKEEIDAVNVVFLDSERATVDAATTWIHKFYQAPDGNRPLSTISDTEANGSAGSCKIVDRSRNASHPDVGVPENDSRATSVSRRKKRSRGSEQRRLKRLKKDASRNLMAMQEAAGMLELMRSNETKRWAIKWCEYVDGKTIQAKLPVHMRNQYDRYERNQRVKDAVKRAKPGLEKLKELNEALRCHPSQRAMPSEPEVEGNLLVQNPQVTEPVLMPRPLEQPEPDALRDPMDYVFVAGSVIGRHPADDHLRRRRRRKGDRGKDKRSRRKRRCGRCISNNGGDPYNCIGRSKRERCKFFDDDGDN